MLDVANTALASIGAKPIASFDEDSKGAEACRLLLKRCVERAQSAAEWHELKKTVELVPTGREGYFGVEYNAPADCLKIIKGFVGDPENEELLWEQEGKTLRFQARNVKLRYIRRSDNPSEWSVHLRGLATEILAAEIVGAVTGEWSARYRLLEVIHNFTLPSAIAENSKKNPAGNFYRKPKKSYFEG